MPIFLNLYDETRDFQIFLRIGWIMRVYKVISLTYFHFYTVHYVRSGNFSKAWRTPWGWSFGLPKHVGVLLEFLAFMCVNMF